LLITLGLLTSDFVEQIWMIFMKMKLGEFGRNFKSVQAYAMLKLAIFLWDGQVKKNLVIMEFFYLKLIVNLTNKKNHNNYYVYKMYFIKYT